RSLTIGIWSNVLARMRERARPTGMRTSSVLAALAVASFAHVASAQTQVLTWPTQNDIDTFLQNAQIQMQHAQACDPIEIAPGVKMPIPCMTNLPKPPVDAPDASLPMPAFVPAAI